VLIYDMNLRALTIVLYCIYFSKITKRYFATSCSLCLKAVFVLFLGKNKLRTENLGQH